MDDSLFEVKITGEVFSLVDAATPVPAASATPGTGATTSPTTSPTSTG
jgi:hypothetical protein